MDAEKIIPGIGTYWGCLLGTATGDAMGLCFENLSRTRQLRLFRDVEGYHFFFGKGMVSDDTEHACMTAQALIFSAGEPDRFIRRLSRNLRYWIIGLPAGIGYATLRAILKLWLGFPGEKSGVFSAGNGPAMRSPIIGVCFGHDTDRLRELVRCSTRITHKDPKAEAGAMAVALAAYMASQSGRVSPGDYYERLRNILIKDKADEFLNLMRQTVLSAEANQTTQDFADSMGWSAGISGYIFHTVPAVIHCWLSHQHDFEGAVKAMIRCGGDTDTTAAIVGAIVGSSVGPEGIPEKWRDNLWEWPRTVAWMADLGTQLAQVCESGSARPPLSLPFYGIFIRNIAFMLIVLCHGLRRLFPPY
ncbi:MAG: dinitrogenase reductase [Desulfobacteraceae bacterium IS3]|nr:MAG: dinitrogenase reductase [Desulfobacteraceae bacterium IS3]